LHRAGPPGSHCRLPPPISSTLCRALSRLVKSCPDKPCRPPGLQTDSAHARQSLDLAYRAHPHAFGAPRDIDRCRAPHPLPITPFAPRVRTYIKGTLDLLSAPYRRLSSPVSASALFPCFRRRCSLWRGGLTASLPPCIGSGAPPHLGAALGTDAVDPCSPERRRQDPLLVSHPAETSPFLSLGHDAHLMSPWSCRYPRSSTDLRHRPL
jgi:hypothetical protein